jgi:hypothetical protein
MNPKLFLIAALFVAPVAVLSTLSGCEEKKPAGTSATKPATPAKADDHGHGHGHGGAAIPLGEQTIGSFTTKATRDEGEIVAGGDAAFDVTITPAAGATTKAAAVRFWIGTQDAKGSVKAKAEIEDAKDPNRWHVHVEIPNPMPAGSKLWVEIEDDKGSTVAGSYDLKM